VPPRSRSCGQSTSSGSAISNFQSWSSDFSSFRWCCSSWSWKIATTYRRLRASTSPWLQPTFSPYPFAFLSQIALLAAFHLSWRLHFFLFLVWLCYESRWLDLRQSFDLPYLATPGPWKSLKSFQLGRRWSKAACSANLYLWTERNSGQSLTLPCLFRSQSWFCCQKLRRRGVGALLLPLFLRIETP